MVSGVLNGEHRHFGIWLLIYLRVPGFRAISGYIRKNDKLKIGGAILQSINYNFYKGKFYKIIISTQSSDNFEALKEVLFKKFGPVEKNQEEGMWIWFGNITRAYLWYDESSETGHFVMSSIEISTQEEADKEQEVKEGAETGF